MAADTLELSGGPAESRLSLPLEAGLLFLLLLIAGGLRMAAPGLTEFKADEARLMALALDMAEGQLALRGIDSSVGFPNFPASVWIYSIPLIFWPHPYAATIFTGLLNTAAVAGSYWLIRRYWGITAALAATLMLAVSPWAVIFSRKIWAQNLLPLFVLGWAAAAMLAFVDKRPKFIWLHLVCLAIAVQIHLAAIALIPATVILLIIFWRRIWWRSLLIGLFLAALTVIPFAVYWGQSPDRSTIPAISAGENAAGLSADAVRFATMLSLGHDIHSLAGPEAFAAYLDLLPPMAPIYWTWGLLIISGIIILIWGMIKQWRMPAAQAGAILLVWLLIPVFFFLLSSLPVFLHYFIATLPAQYIAAGIAFGRIPDLSRLWRKKQPAAARWLRILSWAGLVVTAFIQVWALAALLTFLGRTATPGAFGVPLFMKMDAAAEVRSLFATHQARELLIAGSGESVRHDAFPAEWDTLLRDVPHRFVDVDHSALFPDHSAVVLLDGRDVSPTWTGDIYQDAAATIREIPLRPGEGSYYVLLLPGAAKPQPSVQRDPPDLLANWVHLLGYDQLQRIDDETGLWQIHWRTADNPDAKRYQFFNHLLDKEENRMGQADAAAFAPGQWTAGDRVISRFLIPWPKNSTPEKMRVGMYRFPSLENVPLLDAAGNPYLDAATFFLDNHNALEENDS
ncbi:MAG: hypothetical protein R3293_20185 [Candidatus Promineifilaceae bacterium]|nr:hypothetical protein [Candidatus Promineifilaceae bacterium]